MLENIKIGGMTYDVAFSDLTTHKDDEIGVQLGYCHYQNTLIEINSRVNTQRQEQTFIHEMMHAIFCEAGLSIENEEDIVNRISLILYQVLKDNDFSWVRDNHHGNYGDGLLEKIKYTN